ncbi:hypothetical protein EI999_11640, partial [Streptococcus suis]
TFFYTQKSSIISMVDLPTTDIIEPFYYGFEPVFLVEKNKKTTSIAGGCQGFELPFLFPVIISCSG